MKKLAVVLVLVGILTFSSGLALAEIYSKTLCANGVATANILATYIGSHSGRSVYSLNGWVQHTDGRLSGTATVVPGSGNIHWAFTVHRAEYPLGLAEVWDFTTDLALKGSGYYRTTDSSLEDWLTITPGPCPPTD